jgi:hypothetical protein
MRSESCQRRSAKKSAEIAERPGKYEGIVMDLSCAPFRSSLHARQTALLDNNPGSAYGRGWSTARIINPDCLARTWRERNRFASRGIASSSHLVDDAANEDEDDPDKDDGFETWIKADVKAGIIPQLRLRGDWPFHEKMNLRDDLTSDCLVYHQITDKMRNSE